MSIKQNKNKKEEKKEWFFVDPLKARQWVTTLKRRKAKDIEFIKEVNGYRIRAYLDE